MSNRNDGRSSGRERKPKIRVPSFRFWCHRNTHTFTHNKMLTRGQINKNRRSKRKKVAMFSTDFPSKKWRAYSETEETDILTLAEMQCSEDFATFRKKNNENDDGRWCHRFNYKCRSISPSLSRWNTVLFSLPRGDQIMRHGRCHAHTRIRFSFPFPQTHDVYAAVVVVPEIHFLIHRLFFPHTHTLHGKTIQQEGASARKNFFT